MTAPSKGSHRSSASSKTNNRTNTPQTPSSATTTTANTTTTTAQQTSYFSNEFQADAATFKQQGKASNFESMLAAKSFVQNPLLVHDEDETGMQYEKLIVLYLFVHLLIQFYNVHRKVCFLLLFLYFCHGGRSLFCICWLINNFMLAFCIELVQLWPEHHLICDFFHCHSQNIRLYTSFLASPFNSRQHTINYYYSFTSILPLKKAATATATL